MYNDSRIKLPKFSQPVSFPALMALYESNYLRVLSFLEQDRSSLKAQAATSSKQKPTQHYPSYCWSNNDYQVQVKIEEVTKYTILVCIDEDFISDKEPVRINHFRVRLYHDAQVAAVHSSLHATDQYQLDTIPIDKTRITELWQQNMYFNKWLEYCANRNLQKHEI